MLKITSFGQFQSSQRKAQTPRQIQDFILLSIPFSKLPNIFLIFFGGDIQNIK
jgi:hypothetical protein